MELSRPLHALHAAFPPTDEDPSYLLLTNHFWCRAPVDEQHIRMTAHAVYAWMPTMIGAFSDSSVLQKYADEMQVFRIENAQNLIRKIGEPIVKSSWVGTSKTLHVLRPDVFPIWDSRVARVFGLRHYYQYKDMEHYLQYLTIFYHMLRDPQHQALIASRAAITPVRSLERLFYLAGEKR